MDQIGNRLAVLVTWLVFLPSQPGFQNRVVSRSAVPKRVRARPRWVGLALPRSLEGTLPNGGACPRLACNPKRPPLSTTRTLRPVDRGGPGKC
jgi:hypothetical protein